MNQIEMIGYSNYGDMKLAFPKEKKLAAIKFIHETANVSLKACKRIVETYADEFSGKFVLPVAKKKYTIDYKLDEDIPF